MATKFLDKLDYDFDLDKGLSLIDEIYNKYSIPYTIQKSCRTSKTAEQELKYAMKKISKLEKALLKVIGVSKLMAGVYGKNNQKQAELSQNDTLDSPIKAVFEEIEKLEIEIVYNPVKSINNKIQSQNENLKSKNYEGNIKELQDIIKEKDNLIQEKDSLIEEKDGLIEEKDDLIEEKNGLIKEKDNLIEEKTSELEGLQSQFEELEDENDDLNEKLTDKNKTIKSLKSNIESLQGKNYLEKYEEEVRSHSKTKSSLKSSQSYSNSNDFFAYSSRCQATTQKGNQCRRTAQSGSSYCWQH